MLSRKQPKWLDLGDESLDAAAGGLAVSPLPAIWRNVQEGAQNAWGVAQGAFDGLRTYATSDFRPGEKIEMSLGQNASHDYVVRTQIPNDVSTEAAAFGLMARNAPVAGGYNSSPERDMLQGVITNNPARYEVPNDITKINITEEGHILHQPGGPDTRGQVVNTIVTDPDGTRWFESRGTAQAPTTYNPAMLGWNNAQQLANSFGGFGLFREQQRQMLEMARENQADRNFFAANPDAMSDGGAAQAAQNFFAREANNPSTNIDPISGMPTNGDSNAGGNPSPELGFGNIDPISGMNTNDFSGSGGGGGSVDTGTVDTGGSVDTGGDSVDNFDPGI